MNQGWSPLSRLVCAYGLLLLSACYLSTAAAQSPGQVESLSLMSVITDQPIAGYDVIAQGMVIDLSRLPTRRLNIRANTSGRVGSVLFELDGKRIRADSELPFSVGRDNNQPSQPQYYSWGLPLGQHTLTMTPFANQFQRGDRGEPLNVRFTVVENGTPPPPPPTPSDTISLLVVHFGGGNGRIVSQPPGIDCATNCVGKFERDSGPIVLTAVAAADSEFAGWGRACADAGTATTCTVSSSRYISVAATFERSATPPPPPPPPPSPDKITITIDKLGTGAGRVTSQPRGIYCGGTCSFEFDRDSGSILLTAIPTLNSAFVRWGGDCAFAGSNTKCTLATTLNSNVSAVFDLTASPPPEPERITLTVNKAGNGSGKVTSQPAGIDCGSTCVALYEQDSGNIRLTAEPAAGSQFAGWSGSCLGNTLSCSISSNADKSVTATFSSTAADVDLRLSRFYLNQAVPAADSTRPAAARVPTVAGRAGLVRAFVTANRDGVARPKVALFYQTANGQRGSIVLDGPGAVPSQARENDLGTTFNGRFDASFLSAGLQAYVMVDPDNEIAESNESNNRIPASGFLNVDTVSLSRFDVTMVPMIIRGQPISISPSKAREYLDATLRMFPIGGFDIDLHAPYSYGGTSWSEALRRVDGLRRAEGSRRYYHGIASQGVQPETNVVGIGYINGRAAVSLDFNDSSVTVAHELGHNLSLPHAPCGEPPGTDRNYPYPNAQIGVWGFDIFANSLKDPGRFVDVMSYCSPEWISDYNYNIVVDHRVDIGSRMNHTMRDADNAGRGKVLLVSGVVDDGSVSLDPAFVVDTQLLPNQPGRYTLVGRDAAGAQLFSEQFGLSQVDHESTQHFSLSIGLLDVTALTKLQIELQGQVLAERRVAAPDAARPRGAGSTQIADNADGSVTVDWDATAHQAVLIKDASSGETLGMDFSGSLVVYPQSRVLEIIYSNGVTGGNEVLRF